MTRFIWRNWWRHKQRFILLLVGILIISSGLTFLSTLTESNFGTVSETLEKKWKASYDIVVRPPGTRSITEEDQLFEPNFLSGIAGGISTQQYETIKRIADVDIAAPIAVMGYVKNYMSKETVSIPEFGVYRVILKSTSNSGIHEDQKEEVFYFSNGIPLGNVDSDIIPKYGLDGIIWGGRLSYDEDQLLVGIDPEQESRLVGLDQAVLPVDNSRFFRKSDVPYHYKYNLKLDNKPTDITDTTLPVLVSSQPFVDRTTIIRIDKLDFQSQTAQQISESMEMVKQQGGRRYLDTIKGVKTVVEKSYDSRMMYESFFGLLTGLNPYTGKKYEKKSGESIGYFHQLFLQPTPLDLSKAISPFPDRWVHAYRANPLPGQMPSNNSRGPYTGSFRLQQPFPTESGPQSDQYTFKLNMIGVYDPGKLNIAKDPASESPLETYRAATAKLVLDADGNPVNPPKDVQATLNPLGLLTAPPTLLTTIEGAKVVLGDQAISAIRVKVGGISDLSVDSQAKVNRVAEDIERETGLIADVIMGSSPQPALIQLPANGDLPALGWIELMWMKVGVATGIFQETQMGFSVIMLLILFVAVLYVQATQLVSLYMRRKEFAVLLAVGWEPSRLKRMLIQEAALLGLFALVVSGAIGYAMYLNDPERVSLARIGMFASLGLVVYVLGSIWPAWLSGRIKPYETMRTGEIAKQARRLIRTGGMFAMALNHFLGKFGRYSLSVVSIALPTALLVLLLFITLRLKGVLYTSWIGQYISVQIGTQHYVAIAVTLVICILTTGELVWQNVTERKTELFLLKSIGWRSGAVRRLILLEGWVCGLLAGAIGYGIGLLLVWYMYSSIPWLDAMLLLPVCLLPMLIGVLSAWIPAEFAVRGFPAGTMRTIYSSGRRTQRAFFAAATAVGLIVLAIGGKLAYDYIPQLIAASAKSEKPQTSLIKEPDPIGNMRLFEPRSVPNGSKATYDLALDMDTSGEFSMKAVIDVTNESQDNWDQLVFYMIPNVLTAENKPSLLKDAATVQISDVQLNGQQVPYNLERDTLSIPISGSMQPNATAKVEVSYNLTLPEAGLRLGKTGENYFLAQWYPMLANYNNGWVKGDYIHLPETYLTDFTEFRVRYNMPDGFTVISSADDEPDTTLNSGLLTVKRSKEVFIAIVKDMAMRKTVSGGTEIRVFGSKDEQTKIDVSIDQAEKAFQYFQDTIGLYPRKQLDIILTRGSGSVEYPGIVTVDSVDDHRQRGHTIAHEIAHQWFYGTISNDPYQESFLDEGFTEFSASLLRLDHDKLSEAESFRESKIWESRYRSNRKPSNLPAPEYGGGSEVATYLYAQPALMLWELFSQYEGIETAKAYLKAYYKAYAFKQVDTKEFVRFTKAYFHMEDDKFFESWLKL